MRPRYLVMLLALSAIWGSSFMWIKIGVREISPATLVLGRVGTGMLTLVPVVLLALGARGAFAELRRHWCPLFLVGALNAAVPFWLLSWSETRLDSGLAAIIQAAAPIFVALLALRFVPSERVTGWRLVGLLVGFAGVGLLVGVQEGGDVVAALAVVATALCYAGSILYAGRRLKGVQPMVIALGTLSERHAADGTGGDLAGARVSALGGDDPRRARSSGSSAARSPTSSTSGSWPGRAPRGRSSSPTSCRRSPSSTAPSSSASRSRPRRSPGSR